MHVQLLCDNYLIDFFLQIQEYAEYLLAEGANPLEGSFFDPCAVTIVARKGPQFRSVAESLGKGGVDMLKKRDKYGWSVARDFHELLSQHVHEDVVSTDFGEPASYNTSQQM